MKTNLIAAIFLFSVLLCVFIPAVTATSVIAESGSIPVVGTSEEFTITADSLPNGINYFSIIVSLSDPVRGEILSVRTPAWADIGDINGVPVSGANVTVPVMADTVDVAIGKLVEQTDPLLNLTFITLTIRGDSAGSTGLNITIRYMQTASGSPIPATAQNGTIVIGSPPPTTTVTTMTTVTTTTTTPPPTTTVTTTTTTPPPTTTVTTTTTTPPPTTTVTTTTTTPPPTTTVTTTTTTPPPTTTVTTTTTTPPPTTTVTTTTTTPTTGSVTIQSTPENAFAFLDGTLVGLTPLTVSGVAPGSRQVRIEKTGYEQYQTTASVSAGATTLVSAVLTLIPDPTTGSLNIQSTPANASAFLDGTLVGLTPVNVSGVAPGSHQVRIEKTGYTPFETTTSVSAGATTLVSTVLSPVPTPTTTTPTPTTTTPTPTTVTPTPTPTSPPVGEGTLYIRSSPFGARVLVDDVYRGQTPLLLSNVPAGTRQVTLEKAGYLTKTFPVTVTVGGLTAPPTVFLERGTSPTTPPTTPPTTIPTTGQTTIPTTSPTTLPTTIPPFPVPTTGTIVVYSMPFGCSVSVDDVYRGLCPAIIKDVTPGSHEVRVTFPGYQEEVRTVNVIAGKWTTVTAVLLPDISPLLAVFQ